LIMVTITAVALLTSSVQAHDNGVNALKVKFEIAKEVIKTNKSILEKCMDKYKNDDPMGSCALEQVNFDNAVKRLEDLNK